MALSAPCRQTDATQRTSALLSSGKHSVVTATGFDICYRDSLREQQRCPRMANEHSLRGFSCPLESFSQSAVRCPCSSDPSRDVSKTYKSRNQKTTSTLPKSAITPGFQPRTQAFITHVGRAKKMFDATVSPLLFNLARAGKSVDNANYLTYNGVEAARSNRLGFLQRPQCCSPTEFSRSCPSFSNGCRNVEIAWWCAASGCLASNWQEQKKGTPLC
jgi:hypothetical protein